MLWRASGNLLHYQRVSHRMRTMTERVNDPPKQLPNPLRPPLRRRHVAAPEGLIERQAEPFIDICQAYRLWESCLFGPWVTFDLKLLARYLGKKPWYRPLVSSLDP